MSRTTMFSLIYMFLGAVMFTVLYISTQANQFENQSRFYASLVSNQLEMYIRENKTSLTDKDLKKYLSRLLRIDNSQKLYVILMNQSKYEVIYSNFDTKLTNEVVSLLKSGQKSKLNEKYIYSIQYIPDSVFTFFDQNTTITMSQEHSKKVLRLLLVTITPINKIFVKPAFIFITVYFLIYILFLSYFSFHVRNYEGHNHEYNSNNTTTK